MFLSVIIPTRNRASYLASALKSITKQTYPNDMYEVLVIDNGSTDNTREVCNSFKSKILNLHYFYDEEPGLHVGRHLGMQEAKSDILVYADDDIDAFPTWLEGIAESFQDENVVLVGGKNLPKFEVEPPDWIKKMWGADEKGMRILIYLSILDLGDAIKTINPYHVFGCNFSIRKKILLEAGGFHPDAMPQELIRFRGDGESHVSRYILARGYKTLYNPKASVYHLVTRNRMTEDYFCRRAYNEGISHSYTQLRNAQNTITKSKILASQLVFMKRLVGDIRNKLRIRIHESRELRELYKVIDKGYDAGFSYHQMVYRELQEVRDWVHKNNY